MKTRNEKVKRGNWWRKKVQEECEEKLAAERVTPKVRVRESGPAFSLPPRF